MKNEVTQLKNQTIDFFQGLQAKILGSLKLKDILPVDTCLPKMNKTKQALYYNFITKNFIRSVDIGSIQFITRDDTRLVCYLEKSLVEKNKYLSQTRLENFTLLIFGGRLQIDFKSIELISNETTKNKASVEVGNVSFKKELAFLDALSKNIKIPGTGILLNIFPDSVVADYTYGFPGISGGVFTMTNLKFNVGVTVPFPTGGRLKPVRASFGINTYDDPFVIAVSIFGGRGIFVLETTPRYISKIDCGFEFGGYLGLNLGIAQGQAYLMAGIRYVYTHDDAGESTMNFYGYLTCGGSITVFGFISISVCFLLCMSYQKQSDGTSSLSGTASLSLSVKVGFFEKSFSLTFTKTIAGTDSNNKSTTFIDPFFKNDEIIYAGYHENNFTTPPAPKDPDFVFTRAGWKMFCTSFCYD